MVFEGSKTEINFQNFDSLIGDHWKNSKNSYFQSVQMKSENSNSFGVVGKGAPKKYPNFLHKNEKRIGAKRLIDLAEIFTRMKRIVIYRLSQDMKP